MRPSHFLLIMTFKVVASGNCSLHHFTGNWSSSLLKDTTISADVKIEIFHPAMQHSTDLVAGLLYNATLSGEVLTSASSIYLVIYNETFQEPADLDDLSGGTRSYSTSMNDHTPLDVLEVSCLDDGGFMKEPRLLFPWSSPEDVTLACLSILSVVFVAGRSVRSQPCVLCKPSASRMYHTAPSGAIFFNGSQDAHKDDTHCYHTIIGEMNSEIDLQFQYFDVDANSDGTCDNFVSVSLYDAIVEQFCGTLTPQELRQRYFVTDSGIVNIHITLNNHHKNAAFIAEYHIYNTNTTSKYSQISGNIPSPSFHSNNPSNYLNVTRINLPREFRISVQLLHFDLINGSSSNCAENAVVIRDVVSNKSKYIPCSKSLIPQKNEEIFQSDSSDVEIQFLSHETLESFQFFYRGSRSCRNRTYTSSSGVISSPVYPNNYLNNQDCLYVVAEDGSLNALDLHFVYFHTESDETDSTLRNDLCSTDFLEIQSRGNTRDRICGNWSGKEHLLVFRGLRTPVLFRFFSNSEGVRIGFFATWMRVEVISGVCSSKVLKWQMRTFEVIYPPQTWFDSDLDCRSRSGLLAKIDDVSTHELIELHLMTGVCQSHDSFWIGANDLQRESEFDWSGGEKVSFSRWFSGWASHHNYSQQPSDDGLGNEDCVEIRRLFHLPWKGTQDAGGYFWNDRSCTEKNPYICMIPSLGPTSSPSVNTSEQNVTLSVTDGRHFDNICNNNCCSGCSNYLSCQTTLSRHLPGVLLKFEVYVIEEHSQRCKIITCCHDVIKLKTSTSDNLSRNDTPCFSGDFREDIKSPHHVTRTSKTITITIRADALGICPVFFKISLSNDLYVYHLGSALCSIQCAETNRSCTARFPETEHQESSTFHDLHHDNSGRVLWINILVLYETGGEESSVLPSRANDEGNCDNKEGQASIEIPERVIEIANNSTIDIYSINFLGYPSSDVSEIIIIRVPIGQNIHVHIVEYDVTDSIYQSSAIKFEDISLGYNKSELLEFFCFVHENETRQDPTRTEQGQKSKIWDKIHVTFEHEQLMMAVNVDEQENRERFQSNGSATNLGDSNCTLMSGQGLEGTGVTSFLHKMRITLTGFVRVHLSVQAVEDTNYLNKTKQISSAHFDKCTDSPCLNNGQCHQTSDDTAICECPSHYTGLFCQALWCSLEPCVQGVCHASADGYYCSCPEGSWGSNCEMDQLSCDRSSCSSRGHCLPGNTSHPACACSDGWSGPMCTKRLDKQGNETTVGQRLLKEPIWIGLIVILSVIMLFGILYIVRRRCGKYFNCCDISNPKAPDDNILNSDGTITLNSYPLRNKTRTPSSSLTGASPTFHRTASTKTDTPASTPGMKNGNAAARFFASYKDTERSLIPVPLATDFSLSEDADNVSVCALIGGRLRFDLNVQENKDKRESMLRANSLLEKPDKPKTTLKRSYSSDNFVNIRKTNFEELSHENSAKKTERLPEVGEFAHIYPRVIVQSPAVLKHRNHDGSFQTTRKYTDISERNYVASSNIDVCDADIHYRNEEYADILDLISSENDIYIDELPVWKQHSRSADSIHRLQQEFDDNMFRKKMDEDFCLSLIREWKKIARQKRLLERLAAQRKIDTYSLRNRQDGCNRTKKSLSTPCINQKNGCVYPRMARSYTANEDPVSLSEVSKRRERFSDKTRHVDSSPEDIFHQGYYSTSSDYSRKGNSNCRFPVCVRCRSESLTSDASSLPRISRARKEKIEKNVHCRRRHKRKNINVCRTVSTSSDQMTKHPRQLGGIGSRSHRRRQFRPKLGTLSKTLGSAQTTNSSSTDSDLVRVSSVLDRSRKKRNRNCGEREQNVRSIQAGDAAASSITEQVTGTPAAHTDEKYLFWKVFSEEVELDDFTPELDDFSPVEEAGDDFMLRSKLNYKENFLGSDPHCGYLTETHVDSGDNPYVTVTIDCDEDISLCMLDAHTSASATSKPRRHSVATQLSSTLDGLQISRRSSLDAQNIRDATASSGCPGTPTTCNVIMYDESSKSLVRQDTVKFRSRLPRKHSSLDLVEPLTVLEPCRKSLCTASSIQEVYDISQPDNHVEYELNSRNDHTLLDMPETGDTYPAQVLHSRSLEQNNVGITVECFVEETSLADENRQIEKVFTSSLSSPENASPQSRRAMTKRKYACPNFASTQYLSVTDTDSAMSSAPSPQTTPSMCKTSQGSDPPHIDRVVKDSAYQTKQSSLETEALNEARTKKPVLSVRDEDGKVTQRLHQAAVKLLVIQQRIRRARQNMSKDSAVHTISEDDATLDDVSITSPKKRAFKSGVLYPVSQQHEQTISELSSLQCTKIVEEQDTVAECEV